LVLAHELPKHAKVEHAAVRSTQPLEQAVELGSRLEQLDEALKVAKVEKPAALDIGLL